MNNINLLPRKSRIQTIFWPVMLSVIIIYGCIALFLMYAGFSSGVSIEDKNKEILKLQADIASMREIRKPDPIAADFEDFQTDVNNLKLFRRDWIEILQQVSSSLPVTARVLSFKVNDLGELEMDSQFGSLQQLAEYIAELDKFNTIKSVNATKIARVELDRDTTTPTPDPLGNSLGVIPGLTNPLNPNGDDSAKDDFIANLENNITPPQDESEQLLNELRWLMEQKAAKEQYDILVPMIDLPDAPNIDSWMDSGLFTPEELDNALQQLEAYKSLTITSSEVEMVEKKKINVYQTNLTIRFNALDMGKEGTP